MSIDEKFKMHRLLIEDRGENYYPPEERWRAYQLKDPDFNPIDAFEGCGSTIERAALNAEAAIQEAAASAGL